MIKFGIIVFLRMTYLLNSDGHSRFFLCTCLQIFYVSFPTAIGVDELIKALLGSQKAEGMEKVTSNTKINIAEYLSPL